MSWSHASRPNRIPPLGAAILLALPLLLIVLLTGLAFPAQTDEAKFHWEVIQEFGRTWPAIPWRDYHAATTPLPYIAWALWGKAFGYSLPALRALTLVASYAGVLAFYFLARRRELEAPETAALLLLFSPYVFLHSFTIYTVNMGLLPAVLAAWAYLEWEKRGWPALLAGGIAASAAIYCRQHYLFLPAGVGIIWLARRVRERRLGVKDLRDGALIALPALALAPMVTAWGGLTPPDFQSLHPLSLHPEHLNFLLIFIGAYLWPAGVTAWPAVVRMGRRSLWAVLGAPFFALFRPQFGPNTNSEEGIILHSLALLAGAFGLAVPVVVQLGLWANGLAIGTAHLPRQERSGWAISPMLWAWAAAFAGILLMSEYTNERFYALLMPVLLLICYPSTQGRPGLRWAWIASMAGVAAVYSALKMSAGLR